MQKQAYIRASILTLKHLRALLLLAVIACTTYSLDAQVNRKFKPSKIRILFVLDGSGSMTDSWEDADRFEVSKRMLVNMIDSIQTANPEIEIGIRIFGFQSPRAAKNCQDSKLVIPFGHHDIASVKKTLSTIKPQGWTPIAYSLNKSAADFPNELNAQNAIVLITDGLETCGGDICEASALLAKKKITVKPFVIGLGMGESDRTYFECVGTYYDAASPERFQHVLNLVVAQALNTTTCQILLQDSNKKPTESQVSISVYDHYTNALLYTFVHALDDKKQPDTLWIDPAGRYDFVVHSFPPVKLNDVQLEPGIHNEISIDCPRGTLKIVDDLGNSLSSAVQCLVIDPKSKQTLNMQMVNTSQRYIQGLYNIEALTLPRMSFVGYTVAGLQSNKVVVPRAGTLIVTTGTAGIASIYQEVNEQLVLVHNWGTISAKESINLQPGKYVLVTRWDNRKKAEFTENTHFEISSATVTALRF